MIEDMHIRGLCEKTQQGHIRCVKHFASFLGRSPDTATPDENDIRHGLSGNLCRCTGYTKIYDAVLEGAKAMRETEAAK